METWLTGTPAELDAAIHTLTGVAYVAYVSDRHPLSGGDAGRYRVFLRLALTSTTSATRRPESVPAVEGGALIDLDTARAARRTVRKENPGA
ncbi:hypothetical protein M8I35_22250 [Micromonospora sp. MSM11]|nr:hypothetical protein [Micromonospora sp. MSM11]MCL7459901.1 hypothetical protein [Micromonospora sp. MSM11]